jgi:threonine dehydrogenase-like Zn-dependent dehydrogenase
MSEEPSPFAAASTGRYRDRMIRTARAAVMDKFREPVRVREYPVPSAGSLGRGEALVRVTMAGLCGTDVHLHRGELSVPLPLILGHETVGVVEALGDGLTADWTGKPLAVGDRVTWHSSRSCGKCRECVSLRLPTRCTARRAYGVGIACGEAPHFFGGFAEYHLLKEGSAVFRIPDGVSDAAVIGGGCALVTAIHGVEVVGVHWGERVVVQGAGPVGLAALAIAVDSGARQAILIGGPADRLRVAERFGADAVIDIEEVRDPAVRRRRVLELTDGHGADVVLECVGHPAAVAEGWEFCRDGGRYLVLGHYCDAGPVSLNPHLITRKMITVKGAWSSEPRHTELALHLHTRKADRFPFAELVSHRFGIDAVNEALAATASWTVRKSVIVP